MNARKAGKYVISVVFVAVAVMAYVWHADGEVSVPEPAAGMGVVPAMHKALYDVTLLSVRGDSRLAGIKGEVFFEWQDACDNWSTSHNFKVKYDYKGLSQVQVITDFDSLESKTGEETFYTLTRERDHEVAEEIRGSARLAADNQSGEATYTLPEPSTKTLPANTYFPVEHTFELIKHAQAGEKIFNAYLFEGSDMEDPIEVNAFIGKEVDGAAAFNGNKEVDGQLLSGKAWNVRMAFYGQEEGISTPKYEMTAVLHDNGIVSDMVIEYDEFTVKQALTALEKLESPTCSP